MGCSAGSVQDTGGLSDMLSFGGTVPTFSSLCGLDLLLVAHLKLSTESQGAVRQSCQSIRPTLCSLEEPVCMSFSYPRRAVQLTCLW